MRKNGKKLVVSRETLRTLDNLGLVAGGGASYGLCGTGAGTTVDTNTSNPTATEQSVNCTTGGACTVSCG